MAKPLQILSLQAENLQRISVVRIDPKSGLNIIAGDNEQGKSSTLDALELLLRGKTVMNPEPIRRGSRKATIKAELGTPEPERAVHFELERSISASGDKLKVTAVNGIVPKGGDQTFLTSLMGSIAYDPLEFVTMDPAKQDAALRKIAGVDTTEIDEKAKTMFEARTLENRNAKRLKALLDSMPVVNGAPDERVDTVALTEELEAAKLATSKNDVQRAEADRLNMEQARLKARIEEGQRQVTEAEAKLAEMKGKLQMAKLEQAKIIERDAPIIAAAEALVDPDTTETMEKLKTAGEKNALFEKKANRAKVKEELETSEASAESMSEELTKLKEQKADLLAKAEFPVAGLGIDETGVTFDGVPLCQASTSQKIRVSMAIAAAMQPDLRVVIIRNGNDVDKKKLQVIAATAQEMGLQVLMERIEPGKGIPTWIIEDGTVSAVQDGEES